MCFQIPSCSLLTPLQSAFCSPHSAQSPSRQSNHALHRPKSGPGSHLLDLSAAFDTDHQLSPLEMFSLLGSQDTPTGCSFPGSSVGFLSLIDGVSVPGPLPPLSALAPWELSPSPVALKAISTMRTPGFIYAGRQNKVPQTVGLKNRNLVFYFSQFWKLKVQDQGASKVGFW